MAELKWEECSNGNLNAKVGKYHLYSVSYHSSDAYWFVAPKLKGQKNIMVTSREDGKEVAESLYEEMVDTLIA
jgi:hypothetical protein